MSGPAGQLAAYADVRRVVGGPARTLLRPAWSGVETGAYRGMAG